MGCLFVVMAAMFPRAVLLIFWIARPDRMDDVFTSFVWPVVGIIFFPFATLTYVLLYLPGSGVTGRDWSLVALAGLFDVLHSVVSASRRSSIPAPLTS